MNELIAYQIFPLSFYFSNNQTLITLNVEYFHLAYLIWILSVDFRGQSFPADHWDVLKRKWTDAWVNGWMDGGRLVMKIPHFWEIQSAGALSRRAPSETHMSTSSKGLYISRVTFELFHCCLIYCIYHRISALVGAVLYSDDVFGCVFFNQGF